MMLSGVVAQHEEVLTFQLRQPILCDDSMAKSSDAWFDKEVQIVVIVPQL
jgi:hypothetical protein